MMGSARWVAAVGMVVWATALAAAGAARADAAADAPPGTNAAAVLQPAAAGDPAPAGDPEPAADVSSGTSMIQRLRATGNTGVVQLLFSVFGLSFALERLFNLRRSRIVPDGLAAQTRTLWRAGRFDELAETARQSNSTLGRIVAALVEHRKASHADVSTVAGDLAGREMRAHLQRAYPMAVVATLEPLLGLFGTVLGMVGAFEAVALAGTMGDPSIMAEDISFALMTTVVGLAVAIPSLAAYHFFRMRTLSLANLLEAQAGELLADLFIREEA